MRKEKQTINLAHKKAQNNAIRLRKRLNRLYVVQDYVIRKSAFGETFPSTFNSTILRRLYRKATKFVRFIQFASWPEMRLKPFVDDMIKLQEVINKLISDYEKDYV